MAAFSEPDAEAAWTSMTVPRAMIWKPRWRRSSLRCWATRTSLGVHEDFFALGGDSVLATTVVARVRDWLEIDHALVADLFATRTVAGFAERLQKREVQRGTPERLAVIARHYLDVAALTDEEVLAEG